MDTVLPPAKARLALRFLMSGQALAREEFTIRGQELSAQQWQALEQIVNHGLATSVVARVAAADGTVRLVLRLNDGETVETVAMPVGAVCVSTQVGCAVRCRFCASGKDGLIRNLTIDEILEQVLHARREMRIDRVVYMGMGEPTHNLEAVLEAVSRIRRDGGIGTKRQTLSTVGSVKAFTRMQTAAVKPCLAFSLHSADPDMRRTLLPHAGHDALPDLVAAADAYGRASGTPVQVEWTFLSGVNDRDQDMEQLVQLLRNTRCYVNFIVWNPVHGTDFESPSRARIVELVRWVKANGILAKIRDSAGADAEAACGQLRRRRLMPSATLP